MKEKFNLPPKISQLYVLKEKGFKVPDFCVIDENDFKKISEKIEDIKTSLSKKDYKSVIIRSATFLEDTKVKSFAGVFESSEEIKTEDLKVEDIQKFFKINKAKLKEIGSRKPLFLFIQQFYDFDYSGVLFTQKIYDADESILNLSKTAFGITSGGVAEQEIYYNKKRKKWTDKNSVLTDEIKKELALLIKTVEKIFKQGVDLEIGIKNEQVFVLQARPIIRNQDEKILLLEGKRLKLLFKENFVNQVWIKNNFTDGLGDLSVCSVNFYNDLLSSKELQKLLSDSGFNYGVEITQKQPLRILERIGNRVFLNVTLFKEILPNDDKLLRKLQRRILVKIREKFMREASIDFKREENIKIADAFAWLFLSGLYFQFFLEEDRFLYKKDFVSRLRNTEKLSNATQPFLINSSKIKEFIKNFDYLSENPYEITSMRVGEMPEKTVILKFLNSTRIRNVDIGKTLSFKTLYWLREKVFWKELFLKKLYKEKAEIVKNFRDCQSTSKIIKLSKSYREISGYNYPFTRGKENLGERIIVPGVIKIEKLVFVQEDAQIKNYSNEYIAAIKIPNHWILYIPKFKGILAAEGNELSHVAITCREYNIPYRICPQYFTNNIHLIPDQSL